MKKAKTFLLDTYHSLLRIGTQSLAPNDAQRRITIGVNLMTLSIGLLDVTIGTFVFLITKKQMVLFGVLAEASVITVPFLFNYYRHYNLASLSVYLIMTIATMYFGSVLGRPVVSQLMIAYLIGVALFMFSKRSYRIISIVIAIFVLIFVEDNFKHQYIKSIDVSEDTAMILRWASYTAMFTLVIITYHLYWKNDSAMRSELQDYGQKVEELLKKEEEENKTKDKFLSNASHEMRTSFKTIFAIIDSFYKSDRPLQINSIKKYINILRTACKMSQSINDNIFGYAKYQAGLVSNNLEEGFDIRMLFGKVVEVFQIMAEVQCIGIECRIDDDLPRYALSDAVKIRQILTNLLVNAIKHAPDGSTIYINAKENDGHLLFSVKDQGEGIKGEINHIFEPFVTMNPDGLGLGLFIVREFVNALNGKIDVKTGLNGTRFSVSIPLQEVAKIEKATQYYN